MKKRNLVFVLLATYFTLFIYHIYWLYSIRKDIVSKHGNKADIPPVLVLMIPVIVFFLGLALAAFASSSPETGTILAVAITVGSVLTGLVIACWWYYKFIYAVHGAVKGTDPMPVYIICLLTILFGVGPIWALVTQSDINKIAKR